MTKDLTGQRLGRLVVLDRIPPGEHRRTRRRARGEWLDICPDCLFEEKFGDAHERNDGV